jgi:hypothetical protein
MANGKISATTEKGSSAKVVIGTSAIPLDNYLVVEPVHGRESEAVDESKGTAPFLKQWNKCHWTVRPGQSNGSYPFQII